MIKYTLPDFTHGLSRNLFFIELLQEHPEYFIDGLRIESVYGCFPSCILNGGRTFIWEPYSRAKMEYAFAALDEHHVIPRLTFTNMLARPEHLKDEYVTTILDVASNFPTEIIVYSDELGSLLKERYGFKTVLSTTRGIDSVDEFNAAAKAYDYIVLNYNKNKDKSFLAKLEEPQKIEVMVNEFCRPQCPQREDHYLHNSIDQLEGASRFYPCSHRDQGSFFKHDPEHPVFLTDKEVAGMQINYGIEYFKIVGRGIPTETILEAYTYFLLKPEYRGWANEKALRYLEHIIY